MHKTLLLLGLLLSGPKTGYDLHRILRGHGDFYADLKKANVYYLLDRLAREGHLDVQAESGGRGPRGERLIYSITDRGRARFEELLKHGLRTYEPVPSTMGPAIVFLNRLPRDEALCLLDERRQIVAQQRAQLAAQYPPEAGGSLVALAMDHLLALTDADLAWMDQALERLRTGAVTESTEHQVEAASSSKS